MMVSLSWSTTRREMTMQRMADLGDYAHFRLTHAKCSDWCGHWVLASAEEGYVEVVVTARRIHIFGAGADIIVSGGPPSMGKLLLGRLGWLANGAHGSSCRVTKVYAAEHKEGDRSMINEWFDYACGHTPRPGVLTAQLVASAVLREIRKERG